MIMALVDVPDTYRIVLVQDNGGNQILNVFYYRDTSIGGPSAVSVAEGFWAKVKTAWRAFLPSGLSTWFLEVRCDQLFSPYGFGIYTVPTGERAGTRATSGDFAPIFVAGLITLKVATRQTRPGSKRIAGLAETDIAQNQIVSGTVTLLQTLADQFDTTMTAVPSGIVMTPVIVHYPTADHPTLAVQDVSDGVASSGISHQVSRDIRR